VLADEVFNWLSQQPEWQRDLARCLASQIDLSDDEFNDALAMIKGLHKIPRDRTAPVPRPLKRDDLALSSTAGVARLLGLGSLQGVGLVSENEQLNFAPTGLTVVYGQNGAGKSSYVRTLKKLCRTVDRDCRIRGNIYETTEAGTSPSVKISVDETGTVLERRTTLDGTAAVRLAGMSVFDSACAELYVDSQNIVQYIPTELRLLARLATLQDRLRHAIDAERTELRGTQPNIESYPQSTVVGRAIASLTGSDADEDLTALAFLSEQESARLVELRAAVTAAAASTARADAAAAKRDAIEANDLTTVLTDLSDRITEEAADDLKAAFAADSSAQEAVRIAAEQLEGPVDGIGSEPWQLLWHAAREFIEAAGGHFPPATGEPCPLCLQSVTGDTADRMAHFDAHITSSVRSTATERAGALAGALASCGPDHATTARTNPLLTALRLREEELAALIDITIDSISEQLDVMHANPRTAPAGNVDITPAIAALSAWAEARATRAAALESADDADKLPKVKAELAELEARDRLRDDLDAFLAWRLTLRTIASLDAAYTALATNKITTAQRELTETEIAKALDSALTEELKRLSCALPVELRTRTARAETSIGLRLANDAAPVSDIASEGERRALALCFFFAELTVANDSGGIIVDDPVSSLDDERRSYIVDRLISEAENRQVIVFTHDLPFLLDLQTQAEKAGVEVMVRGMWRQDNSVGRVDEDPPFKAMKLKARIGKLKQRAAQWDSDPKPADQDEAWRRVTAFYSDLRTSWERGVEERLFRGVVQRFQREVKTLALKDVVITPELIAQVDAAMTRTSMFVHDEPAGGAVPLPGRSEIAADLALLEKFAAQAPA
jgi:energy-coupling factor transporter ATP-binding protein EcfA2